MQRDAIQYDHSKCYMWSSAAKQPFITMHAQQVVTYSGPNILIPYLVYASPTPGGKGCFKFKEEEKRQMKLPECKMKENIVQTMISWNIFETVVSTQSKELL